MKSKKVKVEVFVPLGFCICNFAPLMEKVGQVTAKYKDLIDVQVKSTKSSPQKLPNMESKARLS